MRLARLPGLRGPQQIPARISHPTPSVSDSASWLACATIAKRAGDRRPFALAADAALLGSLHHDLDLERRVGELGFDSGARRGRAGGDPGVPYFVHLAPGADVGQPDVGRQD